MDYPLLFSGVPDRRATNVNSGLVFNIQRFSVQDGPGIRTTVFLKGCPLDCWWCHNPESQSSRPQVLIAANRCIRCGQCLQVCPNPSTETLSGPVVSDACSRCGACVDVCPTGARQMIGRQLNVAQVLTEVQKDRVFHEDSGGGVTISGGEPLVQAEFVQQILGACREHGIHSALDTCGYGPQDRLLAVAGLADLVLYDVKFIDDQKHVRYTGVSNQRILENLRALARTKRVVWLRLPVIPGINDTDSDVDQLIRFAGDVGHFQKVSLLPYHNTAAEKFRRLGREYQLNAVEPPTPSHLRLIAQRFSDCGFDVSIGR
jgi:pyruvate formate lyase activating enzyme